MPEILASIGIQHGRPCYNRRSDQLIVVDLLNKIPASEGGSLQIGGLPTKFPNAEEGRCAPQLHQAILRFQQRISKNFSLPTAMWTRGGTRFACSIAWLQRRGQSLN